jgi:hypothetical protein
LPAKSLRLSTSAPLPVPRWITSCMSERTRNAMRSSKTRGAGLAGAVPSGTAGAASGGGTGFGAGASPSAWASWSASVF